MRVGVLLSLYTVAYTHSSPVTALPFSASVWSIGIYFILYSWGFRVLYKEISNEIRLGTIENKVTRPVNYLFSAVAARLGSGFPFFLSTLCALVVILLVWVGLPRITFSPLLVVESIGLFIGGVVGIVLLYAAIGLTAIWLQKADPFFWVIDKSIMVFGGSYIPMALFPKNIRFFAEYGPFGIGTFITQLFNPDFAERAPKLFIAQSIWVGVLGVIVSLMYRRALQKISINGG